MGDDFVTVAVAFFVLCFGFGLLWVVIVRKY